MKASRRCWNSAADAAAPGSSSKDMRLSFRLRGAAPVVSEQPGEDALDQRAPVVEGQSPREAGLDLPRVEQAWQERLRILHHAPEKQVAALPHGRFETRKGFGVDDVGPRDHSARPAVVMPREDPGE